MLRLIYPFYRLWRKIWPNERIEILTPSGQRLKAEVLSGKLDRALGLSYRQQLSSDAVLFNFPKPGHYFFHMRGMKFPIDMVFFDDSGKVAFIAYHQLPRSGRFPQSQVSAPVPVQYVLEMPSMSASNVGFVLGSQVQIGFLKH